MSNVKSAILFTVTAIILGLGSTVHASNTTSTPTFETFKISISFGPTPSGATSNPDLGCGPCQAR